MPKRKNVDAEVVSKQPAVRVPSKAKAPAATHKRATLKKTDETSPAAYEPARHPSHHDIARLAYLYWEARGYEGGSPEEDWFRAERELAELSQNR
jgi:hypothetical protein